MKKQICILCMCMILSGCTVKFGEEETAFINTVTQAESAADAGTSMEGIAKENWFEPISAEERQKIIEFLEQFEEDRIFENMAEEKAVLCGEAIQDGYDFIGRESEDGFGYVLAFRKGEADPLSGVSVYGNDDYISAEKWDEDAEEYKEVYNFPEIKSLLSGSGNEVLLLIPNDREEPEELQKVFYYRYCCGTEGEKYLEDAIDRGVRFTPPETGAYLSVSRFEKGERLYEYVELTDKEERDIIDSDEVVDPEKYGNYGIQFFVSQETYEAEDVDEERITAPALAIAEERCRFESFALSEIHDLRAVKMELDLRNVGKEPENTDSGTVVTEELSDGEQIKRLAGILSSARETGDGKCPFAGALTLTGEDGREIHVSLAADGCSLFVLGSNSFYSISDKEMKELWDMFPEAKNDTGMEPENAGGK